MNNNPKSVDKSKTRALDQTPAEDVKPIHNENQPKGTADFGHTLDWKKVRGSTTSQGREVKQLYFTGAFYDASFKSTPSYKFRKKLSETPSELEAKIINAAYVPCSSEEIQLLNNNKEALTAPLIKKSISYSRKQPYAEILVNPFRKNQTTGKWEKLIGFDLEINQENNENQTGKRDGAERRTYASSSVLQSGSWFKIGVTDDGVHKITYNYLQQLGMDMNTASLTNLAVFGNAPGMLPYNNADFRHDDLKENNIRVVDENNNGQFDKGDYILFYGKSPHQWRKSSATFIHNRHLYSDTTFYFITADAGIGKRIDKQSSQPAYNQPVTSFDDHAIHENENSNLLKSGREWYGEQFNFVTEYDFPFSFPNIDKSEPVNIAIRLISRTVGGKSSFNISVNNGKASEVITDNGVTEGYEHLFADALFSSLNFYPDKSTFNVNIKYNKGVSDARGWLDYIEFNVRRNLTMTGDQMQFRDSRSVGAGNVAGYQLSNASAGVEVWDVTDPINVKQQTAILSGSALQFNATADNLRQFIAFTGKSYLNPHPLGKVQNQNLHGLGSFNMIIITHPLFLTEAEDLAEFHREEDDLTVTVTTTHQVFNEFSSGLPDITAIKDFTKMFYDRAGNDTSKMPDYLLLFGDGSYDPKGRVPGNSNFILTYQSQNSVHPSLSYVSDDYYGLLDDSEGQHLSDALDIGIGRLPVRTVTEAKNMVSKIKHYYNKDKTMHSWRNWVAFVADDEDGKRHMQDADDVVNFFKPGNEVYNVEKIYFDAYQQESTPGGERYPDINQAITRRIQKGALIISYTGHGGELGWAHEKVLEIPAINSWDNIDNMPMLLTATCEFSRYDDPQRTAAGEHALLNKNGGAIALMTTTRLAYSGSNKSLQKAFFTHAFAEADGEMPRLGDICRTSKNDVLGSINTRNFTLLGDPAIKLAYPEFDVVTTAVPDTMKALTKITVTGYVADKSGNKMNDFNGLLYPVVFDKTQQIQTLDNDNDGVFTFDLQNNILFRGKASVKNGNFEFSFVVPKDISYKLGNGRISYYAENGDIDANGYEDNFIIGGSSDNIDADNTGPEVDLYMNDETFVFGGLTDQNPDLYAVIFDEHGINTTGNGLGHDIVAVLDKNTVNEINLNDYYESETDSYQKGSVRYPFKDLDDGKHTLSFKVWDVYNNPSETFTEFIVAENAEIALEHVLNYPNPFTTNTAFYFEHNQAGQDLNVKIDIFTVSGKLVKTLRTWGNSGSFRVGPIAWNGRDEFGDKIGKGVYIYRVKVESHSGEVAEKYEKLVILN